MVEGLGLGKRTGQNNSLSVPRLPPGAPNVPWVLPSGWSLWTLVCYEAPMSMDSLTPLPYRLFPALAGLCNSMLLLLP